MKKIIAIATSLAIIGLASPVFGVTVEELQTQIADLLAQITTLQAQLTALTGAPAGVPAACSGITFTTNLTVGSTGADVKCLQAILNTDAATQVAATGVGSAGNETTYFGPLTKAAVVKYQEKNAASILTPLGLTAGTGYVGSSTRAQLNTAIAGGVVTPPITGVEGSITVTISASPASGANVLTGQTGVSVAAVNVKATGSDVLVSRFDVNFTGISGTACSIRPWLNISGITVTDGTTSKSVSVTQENTTEVTVASDYMVRVDGLGITIPKDTTKTLTIKVDGASALPAGATACALTLTINANAIRGTDGAGLSQYGPTGILASVRSFNVKTGVAAALEVLSDVDNPKARAVQVNEDTQTDKVELLRFKLKAKTNAAVLRTVKVAVTGSTTAATVIPTLYLYDGDTILASTSTAATTIFADMSLAIPKDVTKTLVVKADVAAQSGNYGEGEYQKAALTVSTTNIVAEDAATYAIITPTGSNQTPGNAYFYLKAPSLALVSEAISLVPQTSGSNTYQASAKIKINVTALGGDIYIRKTSTTAPSSGIVASSSVNAAPVSTQTFTSNATAGTSTWRVGNGDTKWFEASAILSNTVTGRFVYALLYDIKWGTAGDLDSDADYTTWLWGLEDFRTSEIYVQAPN